MERQWFSITSKESHQIMIIPINQKGRGLDKAFWLKDQLSGLPVKVDDSDKSPGWKFMSRRYNESFLRIEIVIRDIESNQARNC